MKNNRIIIMQQVLDPSGSGGVSAEYKALENSSLRDKFCFIPLILKDYHKGINLKDISFYYKKIKKVKPDIIHIRGAAIDGLNAIIAAKLVKKTKILVSVHGIYSDLVYISKIKKLVSEYLIEPAIFLLSDGISCVYKCAMERDIFKKHRNKLLPFVYNRMPNFDNYNKKKIRQKLRKEYKISKDNIVGIYCGRVTKEKGLHILVKSLRCLDKNWPSNFSLFIVGDGPYLDDLKEQISKLNNSKNILCIGNRNDIYRYLLASDFFIQPSLHENHSIALLEACAAKLPSIATNLGGNGEIITDGINGILIEKYNDIDLFNAIHRMIYDKKFFMDCVENLINDKFKHFSDIEVDMQLENVYLRLLERKC